MARQLADKTDRVIEARGLRVEHGALILVLPLGCTAALHARPGFTIEARRMKPPRPMHGFIPYPEPLAITSKWKERALRAEDELRRATLPTKQLAAR